MQSEGRKSIKTQEEVKCARDYDDKQKDSFRRAIDGVNHVPEREAQDAVSGPEDDSARDSEQKHCDHEKFRTEENTMVHKVEQARGDGDTDKDFSHCEAKTFLTSHHLIKGISHAASLSFQRRSAREGRAKLR